MKKFASYLSSYQASKELQSISLDKNDLHDDGIRELINGISDRFNNQEKLNFPNQLNFGRMNNDQNNSSNIQMPLASLSLSNTAMSEAGFKYMIAQFGKMH